MKKTDLKNRVAELRMAAELSQSGLGKKIGLTSKTVRCIERGSFQPGIGLVLDMAKVLECRVEDLFYKEKAPTLREQSKCNSNKN